MDQINSSSIYKGKQGQAQQALQATRGVKQYGKKRVIAEYFKQNASGSISSVVETGGGGVKRQKYQTIFPMVPKIVGQSYGKTYDQTINISATATKPPNHMMTYDVTDASNTTAASVKTAMAKAGLDSSTGQTMAVKQMIDFYTMMSTPLKELANKNNVAMKEAGYPANVADMLNESYKVGKVDIYVFNEFFENNLTSNMKTANDWYASNGYEIMTEDRDITIHAPKMQIFDDQSVGYTTYLPCLVGAFVDLRLANKGSDLFNRVSKVTGDSEAMVLTDADIGPDDVIGADPLPTGGFAEFEEPAADVGTLPIKNSMHLCCPVFKTTKSAVVNAPTYETIKANAVANGHEIEITEEQYNAIKTSAKNEIDTIPTDDVLSGSWSWNHRKINNTAFYKKIIVLVPQIQARGNYANVMYMAEMSYQIQRDLIWFKKRPTTMFDLLKTRQNGYVRIEDFQSTDLINVERVKQLGLIGAKTFTNTHFKMGKRQRMNMVAALANKPLIDSMASDQLFKWSLGLWGIVELDSKQFASQLIMAFGLYKEKGLMVFGNPANVEQQEQIASYAATHFEYMMDSFGSTYAELSTQAFDVRQDIAKSRQECISAPVLNKMAKRLKGLAKSLNSVSKTLQKSTQEGILGASLVDLKTSSAQVNGFTYGLALIKTIFFSSFCSSQGAFDERVEIGNTIASGFLLSSTAPIVSLKNIIALRQNTVGQLMADIGAIIKIAYPDNMTPEQIKIAGDMVKKNSSTFQQVLSEFYINSVDTLRFAVKWDFILEMLETTFALSVMYQSGNFKGMSDQQMLGLCIYLTQMGRSICATLTNVRQTPGSGRTFVTVTGEQKLSPSQRNPYVDALYGQFTGIYESLRDVRQSKLMSYNLFFYYSQESSPVKSSLTSAIIGGMNSTPTQSIELTQKLMASFKKNTSAGIGYINTGGNRDGPSAPDVRSGTIFGNLQTSIDDIPDVLPDNDVQMQ